jgi:hypothetical protein
MAETAENAGVQEKVKLSKVKTEKSKTVKGKNRKRL